MMPADTNSPEAAFKNLVAIVNTLMSENGCAWDRVQTRETLKPFLVEEAYETLEALDSNDPEAIKEELGDLLYQIMFHAKIAEKNNEFAIQDVVNAISEKMVHRHPHVFEDAVADTPEAVKEQWEEIKKNEKSKSKRQSLLDGIPHHLPGLARAQKLQKKAAKNGFDWDKITAVFDKLDEEIAEFKEAVLAGKENDIESEFGDILFVLVNLARFQKIDAEEALRSTNNKFIQRFQYIEQQLAQTGKNMKDTPLDELEALWQDAKKEK